MGAETPHVEAYAITPVVLDRRAFILTVMQPSEDRQQPVRRVTVPKAASILGTTPDAIRSRLRRGKLLKEVGEDGTVYVRLEGDGHGDGRGGQSDGQKTVDSTVAYISSLKSQIDLLADHVEDAQRGTRGP